MHIFQNGFPDHAKTQEMCHEAVHFKATHRNTSFFNI